MMIPITDEQAKAVRAVSEFGTTVVTEGSNLARCIGRILGTVPEDAVGLVIGHPLHAARAIAAEWCDRAVRAILERRGVKQTQPVSPSVALPLIRGAYDETREGLRDMWAQLIAAAMDPDRADRVRVSFMETLRKFDPLDAVVLREIQGVTGRLMPTMADFFAQKFGINVNEVQVSFDNLHILRCISPNVHTAGWNISSYGSLLLRACSE